MKQWQEPPLPVWGALVVMLLVVALVLLFFAEPSMGQTEPPVLEPTQQATSADFTEQIRCLPSSMGTPAVSVGLLTPEDDPQDPPMCVGLSADGLAYFSVTLEQVQGLELHCRSYEAPDCASVASDPSNSRQYDIVSCDWRYSVTTCFAYVAGWFQGWFNGS